MKRSLKVIFAAACAAAMLCSCSSKTADGFASDWAPAENNAMYGWDADYDDVLEEVEADAAYDTVATPVEAPIPAEEPTPNPNTNPTAASATTPQEAARKIIKNGDLTLETLEFDRFINDLESSVSEYGGYVESSSHYGSGSNRGANYTVRVPGENYDSFINKVGGLGTVVSSSTSTQDVTLKYIDYEARLEAYKAERDSFMALLDRAETVEEILQIQNQLTEVNYQIESYTSQLNALKDLVSYSTVNISVDEVARVTPPEPKTVGERISTQFKENIYDISEGAKSTFVNFVSSLPYIAIYAAVIAIIALIVFIIVRSTRRKRAKRTNGLPGAIPPESGENGIKK